MGFDLRPRNRSAGDFHMGAFSWSWMLDSGVGLPLGYGPSFEPASFVCLTRPDGKCIGYNDGARVTAAEAREMAKIAVWLADYQDALHKEWMKESEERQKAMLDDPQRIYRPPVRRDFVDKVRAFAEWANRSGGFKVY